MACLTIKEKVTQIAEVIDEIGDAWECAFIWDMVEWGMIEWHTEYTSSQEEQINKLWDKVCESSH